MRFFFAICIFLFSRISFSQEEKPVEVKTLKIEGRLVEKGTKIPLTDYQVVILPHQFKTRTDSKGYYVFESVPEGEVDFVVVAANYEKLEKKLFLTADGVKAYTVDLYLAKISYSEFETTIVGEKNKRDSTARVLQQKEFLALPGAGGDPVKAVQNLPGVSRVAGFSSQVVIQGSEPKDTRYDLDGHEIPLVFHFGGLTSVVMPEAVEQVDYLSAGYGPEYSRALGGIVSLKTRKPQISDRDSKGFAFMDTMKMGGLYESIIDDHSSYLISARYSYIGAVLRAALKDNSSFDLTVAPEFADITGVYVNQLNERDELKIVTLASRDTLEFLLKEPLKEEPGLRGTFYNETSFVRVVPHWTRKWDTDRTSRVSLGVGTNKIIIDIGDQYFKNDVNTLTLRGEWDQKFTKDWSSQIGIDNQYYQARYNVRLPAGRSETSQTPFSASEIREVEGQSNINNIGTYWRNEWNPEGSKWTYLPSLRHDYFNLTKEHRISPRLGARYKWDESLLIKGSGGIYNQPPQPQEVSTSFGNPEIKSPLAMHAMLGFEKDFRQGATEGWILNGGVFHRDFSRLVVSSSQYIVREGTLVPEIYSNKGQGRAQGLEFLLKGEMNPWTTWLSYTLTQSRRWEPGVAEHPSQYDQTHNVNLVGSYQFPKEWKLSGRLRYVTGNPKTPIVGASFDSDNDVYIPKQGPIYSERMRDFSQLDLRVDKKIIDDKVLWSFYADIQNILNSKNPETIRYSYDYSTKEDVTGLPMFFAIGVKGEFQ